MGVPTSSTAATGMVRPGVSATPASPAARAPGRASAIAASAASVVFLQGGRTAADGSSHAMSCRDRLLLVGAVLPLLAGAAGVGGCAAGSQRAGATAGGGTPGAGGFHVIERGEPGPVTALAFAAPYLYAGSAQGLRRSDVAADEYEW